MKIILFLTLTSLVFGQKYDMEKYRQQLIVFCSGVIKNVCTKENLEFGNTIFQNRLHELQEEASRKQKLLREAEQNRRIQIVQQAKLLQLLRKHFLDRHL